MLLMRAVLTGQVQVACLTSSPTAIGVAITERNVPPDYITFVQRATLFDDTPVGTVLGSLSGYDHNTDALSSSVILTMTSCVAPLTNVKLLNDTSGAVAVPPTNCSEGTINFTRTLNCKTFFKLNPSCLDL